MHRVSRLTSFALFSILSLSNPSLSLSETTSPWAVRLARAAAASAAAGSAPESTWNERDGGLPPLTGYERRLRPQYQNTTHLDRWEAVESCAEQIHSRHGDDRFEVSFSVGRLEGKCDEAPVMRWGAPGGPVTAVRLAIASGANVSEVWAAGQHLIFGLVVPYESGYYERRLAIVDAGGRSKVFGSNDPYDETLTILLDQFAAAEAASRGATVFLRANGRTLAVDTATNTWWVTGPATN